ncbi:MAG: hypothetical protein WCA77_02810 [Thermoplasmata archaeon]
MAGALGTVPYSTMRLCSGGGSYEAFPQPRLRVDLTDARARLEASGLAVVDARVMLIVAGEPEVTVSRDGRILVKTRDPREAEATLRRFLSLLRIE